MEVTSIGIPDQPAIVDHTWEYITLQSLSTSHNNSILCLKIITILGVDNTTKPTMDSLKSVRRKTSKSSSHKGSTPSVYRSTASMYSTSMYRDSVSTLRDTGSFIRGDDSMYSSIKDDIFQVDEEMRRKLKQETDVSMVTLLQPAESMYSSYHSTCSQIYWS